RYVDATDAMVAQLGGEPRKLRAVGGQRQFAQSAAGEMARERAHQRHHVAADQRLAAGQPELAYALGDEGRAKPVELFERQRVDEAGGGDAAPGCGNGESAGSLAPFGGFGFLGLCVTVLAALGGGPAGCSSAKTGLGSVMVDAGVAKSPGLRITWTGIVADWNLLRV